MQTSANNTDEISIFLKKNLKLNEELPKITTLSFKYNTFEWAVLDQA